MIQIGNFPPPQGSPDKQLGTHHSSLVAGLSSASRGVPGRRSHERLFHVFLCGGQPERDGVFTTQGTNSFRTEFSIYFTGRFIICGGCQQKIKLLAKFFSFAFVQKFHVTPKRLLYLGGTPKMVGVITRLMGRFGNPPLLFSHFQRHFLFAQKRFLEALVN